MCLPVVMDTTGPVSRVWVWTPQGQSYVSGYGHQRASSTHLDMDTTGPVLRVWLWTLKGQSYVSGYRHQRASPTCLVMDTTGPVLRVWLWTCQYYRGWDCMNFGISGAMGNVYNREACIRRFDCILDCLANVLS